MSIDELVDKVLAKHKNEDDDGKTDIPKPFRYITDEEIQQELKTEKLVPVSVMTFSEKIRTPDIDQDLFTIALGDLDTIESVLKKHEIIRKNKFV